MGSRGRMGGGFVVMASRCMIHRDGRTLRRKEILRNVQRDVSVHDCLVIIAKQRTTFFKGQLSRLLLYLVKIHTISTTNQCCGSGIRCSFDPWIRDGQNSGSGMNIQDYFYESLETVGLKTLKFFDANPENFFDPGSGINTATNTRYLKEHKHEIFFLTFFAETETVWSQGPVTRDF
jgi:hypothetical protein